MPRRQTALVATPLVDEHRIAAWMDEQGLEPGAPLSRRPASRPVIPTRCSASSAVSWSRSCAGRRARRCRRPRTTWHASSVCCTALHDPRGWRAHTPVPVPVPIACCTDVDVIGAPFYLMHLVDGVVVRESLPPVLAAEPDAARACGFALVDALAGIHRVRLERGWARGFRPPRRLPRAPSAALARPARAVQDAPASRSRRGRGVARRARAAHATAGRDPRRLQARQRDARAASPSGARRGGRLGAVDDRRSARRSRLAARAVGRSGRRRALGRRDAVRRSRRSCPLVASCSIATPRDTDRDLTLRRTTTACSACSSSRA